MKYPIDEDSSGSIELYGRDVAGNTNKIIESVRRAKAEGADLVVFAEQAISGAPSFDLLRKNPFLEQCEDALMRIAAECDTVDAIVGLPILTKEGTISAAALIQQGRVVRYVGKQNITVRRELGFLTPSKGCEYVTIRGCRCALVVGDDLFIPRISTSRSKPSSTSMPAATARAT